MRLRIVWPIVLCAAGSLRTADAEPPLTLESVTSPAAIAPDEPLAKAFSFGLAARALDRAALDWQKTHACTACHTMLPYLMARPALEGLWPSSGEVRRFFEEIAAGDREAMPNYGCQDVEGAVAVGVACALALGDHWTGGKLHPLTRQALDTMWTAQRPDGGWQWPFRDTPPIKNGDHFGVTLAAIAAGMAPDDYQHSPAAVAGLQGVRSFLTSTKAVSLHEKAMLLWASAYVDRLLAAEPKADLLAQLMAVQRPDGGWSLASLVDNTDDPSFAGSDRVAKVRAQAGYGTDFLVYLGRDGDYKSRLASDGYATGLVIFVARQTGLPSHDTRLQRGIAWLKSHQRESGRWFAPSQASHTRNLISNSATAYAILALESCGEIPSSR